MIAIRAKIKLAETNVLKAKQAQLKQAQIEQFGRNLVKGDKIKGPPPWARNKNKKKITWTVDVVVITDFKEARLRITSKQLGWVYVSWTQLKMFTLVG